MIDITAKIHDKFSIELKESYVVNPDLKHNQFSVNTWIFLPNSLDINPDTYGKKQFYRDVKNNVRLITPSYSMREMASTHARPFLYLKKSMQELAQNVSKSNSSEYEYQVKMFCAIAKSSLRNEYKALQKLENKDEILSRAASFKQHIKAMISHYRSLRPILEQPHLQDGKLPTYFDFGDEFLGNVASTNLIRTIKIIQKVPGHEALKSRIASLVHYNESYKKKKGFPVVEESDRYKNRFYVFRHSILKKYIESDLFIKLDKKKDGYAVEQTMYALAAGIAMIFATVVSFGVQRIYGALSIPLFVALILSYMLKDRIKELMRFYFAHRLGSKLYDNKAKVLFKGNQIGWMKESVDFITDKKTPREVMDLRNRSPLLQAENRIHDEKVLLYRKYVDIDANKLNKHITTYPVSGINDIFRIHMNRFVQKMDNPRQMIDMIDAEGNIIPVPSLKTYYINMVLQIRYGSQMRYKRYRVALTRNGIVGLEQF